MDFRQYKELVKAIPGGKQLPDAVYLHDTAIDLVPPELLADLAKTISALGLEDKQWNVVKFFKRDHKVTLLNYPGFLEDPYPALEHAYTINLDNQTVRESSYTDSENPPILHRKETFLRSDHPSVSEFQAITEEGEKAGLYDNPKIIGFRKSWERLIGRKGYVLQEDGRLTPKCQMTTTAPVPSNGEVRVERHLTAIDRDKLSVPMQLLARHNYLDGNYSVFDYGCGKGDDVRELEAHGIDVNGWDPVYRSDEKKRNADIVNLGYVVNVIEDRPERDKVLKDAFDHAERLLAVSAMVAGEATISQFRPYKDGVITSRNTFQKYFSQSELRSYIETTLGSNAVAVSPGIFFLFKDELEEQVFLSERQHIHRDWSQLTERERVSPATPAVTRTMLERHQELFDDFWDTCLDLGRIPANSEFEYSDRLRAVAGSHKKAFEALSDHHGSETFEKARDARRGDLLVYFALGLFEGRKPYSHMPEGLKRDVKWFFRTYPDAIREATELLFSVGKSENIAKACKEALAELNCGFLDGDHSFTIHCSLLNDLPPMLRVYVGCAAQLYGDIEGIDLVKIHITSGKVSLMKYGDFGGKPLPALIQRVKINLRGREINVFDYSGDYEPQPLYFKSRFIPRGYHKFDAQLAFDKKLAGLHALDFSGFGPSARELQAVLSDLQLSIHRFDLLQAAGTSDPQVHEPLPAKGRASK